MNTKEYIHLSNLSLTGSTTNNQPKLLHPSRPQTRKEFSLAHTSSASLTPEQSRNMALTSDLDTFEALQCPCHRRRLCPLFGTSRFSDADSESSGKVTEAAHCYIDYHCLLGLKHEKSFLNSRLSPFLLHLYNFQLSLSRSRSLWCTLRAS